MFYVLVLMLLRGASEPDGWLQFRGPNGSGVSATTAVPAEFGPSRNISWKTTIPFGRSSPIVAGNYAEVG